MNIKYSGILCVDQSEVQSTNDPDRSLIYRKQAEYFFSVEKWEAAVDCYNKAIHLDKSDHCLLRICLSSALLNCGRYQEALICIEKVLDLVGGLFRSDLLRFIQDPHQFEALTIKADCLYQHSRFC